MREATVGPAAALVVSSMLFSLVKGRTRVSPVGARHSAT